MPLLSGSFGARRLVLCFPPSWTSSTGSPHLAVPLLAASLQSIGWQTTVFDLNWDFLASNALLISDETVRRAVATDDPKVMDGLVFDLEDRLQSIASAFGGSWNPHEGYTYRDRACRSLHKALSAAEQASPFTSFFVESAAPRILAQEPSLLGFSIASVHQIVPTLELCRVLRRAGFPGFICLGGNTITRLRDEFCARAIFEFIDGFIIYQGEQPLIELARALHDGASLSGVPQLTWRDGDVIRTNTGVAALNPDSVPTPAYDDLPVGRYGGTNHLCVMAARGCYYGKCTFCAIPFGWSPTGFAGVRSAQRVVDDMIALRGRHSISRFKFVDEALPTATMRAIARLIVEYRLDIQWEAYVRLERAWLEPDFVELMAAAGFRKGYFGVEILPSDARDVLNKKDRAHPEAVFRNCAAAGIRTHCFCMFGFPGTTRADAETTVRFLLANEAIIDTADVFPWIYAKHTIVPDVEPIIVDGEDWALDYSHRGRDGDVLDSQEVRALAEELEETVWRHAPRLLHPVYRLKGPWRDDVVETVRAAANDGRRQ